jgi:hypothetical protein
VGAEPQTLYLSNWASWRTHHGPGRLLSIMAKTPDWAKPVGRIPWLTPAWTDVVAAKANRLSTAAYRSRFTDGCSVHLDRGHLAPGSLVAAPADVGLVQSGDTLCCTCSVIEANAGRCHRVWAAELLLLSGWSVVLDGRPLPALPPLDARAGVEGVPQARTSTVSSDEGASCARDITRSEEADRPTRRSS